MPALAAHESPATEPTNAPGERRGRIVIVVAHVIFAVVLAVCGVILSVWAQPLAWVFWVGAGVVACTTVMVIRPQEAD